MMDSVTPVSQSEVRVDGSVSTRMRMIKNENVGLFVR